MAFSPITLETDTIGARIEAALDRVRPAIHRDGGDVWFVRVTDHVAYVQMLGACGSCAMATQTLKGAIETVVLEAVPELRAVEQL